MFGLIGITTTRVPFLMVLFLTFIFAVPTVSSSQENSCAIYQQGELRTNEVAVFRGFHELRIAPPALTQTLTYREEYVQQPHLRGRPGYPYETRINFQMNIDTGQPVPQSDRDYRRNHRNNRDFVLKVYSSWSELYEHLPARASLPLNDSVSPFDYDVLGDVHGMTEITYLPAILAVGGDVSGERDAANIQFFITLEEGEITSFMECHRETYVPVPHCELWRHEPPFKTRVRFKRAHLADIDTVRRRSHEFFNCMIGRELE